MRFLGYTLANEAEVPTEPPSPDLYEKMGRFVEEATKAGVIVATGGIAPTSEGARISLKNGEYTVVDGPFAEAKELVGGWALMECRDLPAHSALGDRDDATLDAVSSEEIDDDRVRLIFVACHPILALPVRVALTLRLVGGLTVPEIARAYVVPEATIAQRIVRAKK